MFISYIVRGSLLVCLASAMMGTTYPEWTAANVGDNVTLSWNIPKSLKQDKVVTFKVMFNVVTNNTFITIMRYSNDSVNVSTPSNHRIQYTGNISTTGEGVFSLMLTKLQKEDAGRYSCVNSNKPLENCGQGLVVLQQPSTPNISISSNSTVPGQPVTLKCSSSSQSFPSDHPFTLSYTWSMNGRDLQLEHGPNLTLHDDAAYSCQATEVIKDKEIRSIWSRQIHLYGPEQVKFDPDSDTVTASEGNINVTCSADCNPPCTVKWFDNIGQTPSHSLQKAVINLNERKSEKFPFKCVVRNYFGRKTRTVSLHIQSSIRNCTSNTGTEDGTINIECTVYGEPQPNVSFCGKSDIWKLNKALPNKTYKYSYVFNHARCSDHGRHNVTASNNLEPPDNYQLYLTVKCAPRMQERHGSIQLQKNKSCVFWSFDILAYPKPISERLYFLPDNGMEREMENKLHCQQQTADNLFTCTVVYPGDETPELGKYVIYFSHVQGDRIFSLNLVDDEVGTESQAIISVAVVCSVLVLVLAVVAAVFIQRYKSKKELRRRRHAARQTFVWE